MLRMLSGQPRCQALTSRTRISTLNPSDPVLKTDEHYEQYKSLSSELSAIFSDLHTSIPTSEYHINLFAALRYYENVGLETYIFHDPIKLRSIFLVPGADFSTTETVHNATKHRSDSPVTASWRSNLLLDFSGTAASSQAQQVIALPTSSIA